MKLIYDSEKLKGKRVTMLQLKIDKMIMTRFILLTLLLLKTNIMAVLNLI